MGLQQTLKALADPIRREILNLLKSGRMSAGAWAISCITCTGGAGALALRPACSSCWSAPTGPSAKIRNWSFTRSGNHQGRTADVRSFCMPSFGCVQPSDVL